MYSWSSLGSVLGTSWGFLDTSWGRINPLGDVLAASCGAAQERLGRLEPTVSVLEVLGNVLIPEPCKIFKFHLKKNM